MKKLSNLEFKKKFDSVADVYEQISNSYTLGRRSESFKINPSDLVLETGSGTGIISESIDKSIICTDISYNMCVQAIKKKRKNVICCDAEKLPIIDDILDGILSTEMIYYLDDPESFIKHSHRTLKNNSRLMITMFNQEMKLVERIQSFLRIFDKNQFFDDGLTEFIGLKSFTELLKKNNFEITYIEKKVFFPFKILHRLNSFMEKTTLNRFCCFIIIEAKCKK